MKGEDMERITDQTIRDRTHNLNHRLAPTGRQVIWEKRNGHVGLDEFDPSEPFSRVRTLTVGTKREVADFLHAMMVGIDMAAHRP